MAPKLFVVDGSPAQRSVLMCAKALGLELEFQTVDLWKGEHLEPEFLKVNMIIFLQAINIIHNNFGTRKFYRKQNIYN